jgi:hypothetical protein
LEKVSFCKYPENSIYLLHKAIFSGKLRNNPEKWKHQPVSRKNGLRGFLFAINHEGGKGRRFIQIQTKIQVSGKVKI